MLRLNKGSPLEHFDTWLRTQEILEGYLFSSTRRSTTNDVADTLIGIVRLISGKPFVLLDSEVVQYFASLFDASPHNQLLEQHADAVEFKVGPRAVTFQCLSLLRHI